MAPKEMPMAKSPLTPNLSELGQKQVQALTHLQKELWNTIQRSNREWLDLMETERNLASELAAKLTSAHSLPDAATAYQEWVARRMELLIQ